MMYVLLLYYLQATMLELVKSRVECPFVYADTKAVSLSSFVLIQSYSTYLKCQTMYVS